MDSPDQKQTKDTFGFKWNKTDTYAGSAFLSQWRTWLFEKYFDGDEGKLADLLNGKRLQILDAGCGAAVSSELLFGPYLEAHDFTGVDISDSVDVARERFESRGIKGTFIQTDLMQIPSELGNFDVIFSEGVLHHTDSVEQAVANLGERLNPSGLFLFYVYSRKAAVREYTDDLIRDFLAPMSNEEAWEALIPLSKLGRALGELDATIHIEEDIPFLGIRSGEHKLQRLLYYTFLKTFFHPDYSLDQLNHINFDWFRPKNCFRHSVEEVTGFVKLAGLEILRLHEGPSGIAVICRKPGITT